MGASGGIVGPCGVGLEWTYVRSMPSFSSPYFFEHWDGRACVHMHMVRSGATVANPACANVISDRYQRQIFQQVFFEPDNSRHLAFFFPRSGALGQPAGRPRSDAALNTTVCTAFSVSRSHP